MSKKIELVVEDGDPWSGVRPARLRQLGDEVFEAIERLIVSGELPAGSRLPSEERLCALFDVSRPVVRNALSRLRQGGLIASRKGSGSHVLERAYDEAAGAEVRDALRRTLHAIEFRRSVEPDAAFFAAVRQGPDDLDRLKAALNAFLDPPGSGPLRVDIEFHRAIARAAHNDHYERALDVIAYDIDLGVTLAQHLSRLGQAERRSAIFEEHAAIVRAIEAQDPDGAADAMRAHLDRSQLRVLSRNENVVRRSAGPTASSSGESGAANPPKAPTSIATSRKRNRAREPR